MSKLVKLDTILQWVGVFSLLGGVIGFCIGFFGPMIFSDSPQGPLVGIFYTGPYGAFFGALLGLIVGMLKSRRAK